jgi:hypothetical protein
MSSDERAEADLSGAGELAIDRSASSRPYIDQPIGDIRTASEMARHTARRLGLDEPVLYRVGMNAIFTAGAVVIRIGRPTAPASARIELAERLSAAGIRVAQPARPDVIEDEGLVATVWHRIEPTAEPIAWSEVGAMVRRVHDLRLGVVPTAFPLPSPATFPWWDFDALLAETSPALDGASRAGLDAAIQRWPSWRDFDDPVVCHGDVHPGNVVMGPEGPVLIDWDLLCLAPRAWDHAPLMTWTERWGGAPGIYEAFAEGYGWSARDDSFGEAFAELRLVAATLMRVRAAMVIDRSERPDGTEPGAEAEQRLRYWRGDSSAPDWRAQ